MTDKTDIEDALIAAITLIAAEAGAAQDIWHPDFGWVLRDGEITDGSEAFWATVFKGK